MHEGPDETFSLDAAEGGAGQCGFESAVAEELLRKKGDDESRDH